MAHQGYVYVLLGTTSEMKASQNEEHIYYATTKRVFFNRLTFACCRIYMPGKRMLTVNDYHLWKQSPTIKSGSWVSETANGASIH